MKNAGHILDLSSRYGLRSRDIIIHLEIEPELWGDTEVWSFDDTDPWFLMFVRATHQLGQVQMAELTGTNQSTISRWESGVSPMSEEVVFKIKLIHERLSAPTEEGGAIEAA